MTETTRLNPIHILGVPMDLGQKRRGVDMGPSAIRYAGLHQRLRRLGYAVRDEGNVRVPEPEEIDEHPNEKDMHHVNAISAVCQQVYFQASRSLCSDCIGIFLGGDHSMSIGTVAAALQRSQNVGVLWIDAHGDFNTPHTTPSGNVHGMVVAALMGFCPPELTIGDKRLPTTNIVYIAVRDLDSGEKAALREHNVKVFTMRDIDELGMARVARETFDFLGDADSLHVSWDLDALDPQVVSGVGTPVPGGLTYREAHLLGEMLADDGRVRSLDLVEVNPILDRENRTARVAVEIAASLFGQRIL